MSPDAKTRCEKSVAAFGSGEICIPSVHIADKTKWEAQLPPDKVDPNHRATAPKAALGKHE
jgi:hypothetical protein